MGAVVSGRPSFPILSVELHKHFYVLLSLSKDTGLDFYKSFYRKR